MKLTAGLRLPFPRRVVFAAYRDDIGRVLEFLPNVRAIEVRRRDEGEGLVRQSSDWHGGGEVPAAVRGIVTQSMLGWTDRAKWDEAAFHCEWIAESHKFPEGVRCRGSTSFLEAPGGETSVDVLGVVEVDARRFPGVPSYLAGPVGRSVEEFLVGRIRANLLETAGWFEKYCR